MTRFKYDWQFVQELYNEGFSENDLVKYLGINKATIHHAKKDGRFVARSRLDGLLLAHRQQKCVISPENELARRNKIRSKILERYAQGWTVRCGRTQKIHYTSKFAGAVCLDGRWELIVALWLDDQNVLWKRNTERFSYVDTKGISRTYCPDFYLVQTNTYLEVKGYETELDRSKWSQFPHALEVWKKQKFVELGLFKRYDGIVGELVKPAVC